MYEDNVRQGQTEIQDEKPGNIAALQAEQPGSQHPNGDPPANVAPVAPQEANWGHIPQELRDRPQWVVAGADKAPLTTTLQLASPTNPATWCDFNTACNAAHAKGLGIGYMLSADDPFTCIDLDVKDDTPQETIDGFHSAIKQFDSYTERSRSGKGFHIWVHGNIGKGRRREGVEVYSQERFMICTGNIHIDKPIAERPEQLNMLLTSIPSDQHTADPLPDASQVETDEVILERAKGAGNSDKFNKLWTGDWASYPSQSEADNALMSMLTFYSHNNEQCRRLFRMSGLGRRDKATKDDRYLNRTLDKIRRREAAEYDPVYWAKVATDIVINGLMKKSSPQRSNTDQLRLITADEIASRPPMKWLIHDVLPERGIGTIFGPPGSGKSFLALHMLGAVAGGFYWFGIKTKAVPVVYIVLEGQAGMPQRIQAYRSKGAVLDQVAFIEQQIDLRHPDTPNQLISLIRAAGLAGGIVCIDTLAASTPGADENGSADMGPVLAALQRMQAELQGFVLVVHHTGKDTGRGPRGWSGLTGAFDCAIETSLVSETKKDSRRKWVIHKSKDGQDGLSFNFELEVVQLGQDEDNRPITSCVVNHNVQDQVTGSEIDAEDDEFIWKWVRNEITAGRFPSKSSLKGQLGDMKEQRQMTQARVRDAIERLMAASRLEIAPTKSATGNVWIRAVEQPQ